VVFPMTSNAENELTALQNQNSALQGKITNVKRDLKQFQENLPTYEKLKEDGFFAEQDRFRMSRDLEKVRELSGIRGFAYEIKDTHGLFHPKTKEAKMRLSSSHIEVKNIDSIFDMPFYKFIGL